MPALLLSLAGPAHRDEEGVHLSARWLLLNDDGTVRGQGVTDHHELQDLIDPQATWIHNPLNVYTIVPAEAVLAVTCRVPGRSAGQMRRALPYVVEEYVATEIEQMHIATGPVQRGEPVRCVVVERNLVADWLAALAELDVRPGHMYADADLLPVEDRQISVLFDGDRVLMRTDGQIASVDRANLVLALNAALAASRPATAAPTGAPADAPEPIRVLQIHGTLSDLEVGQLDQPVALATVDVIDEPAEYLTTRALGDDVDAVNLLQGPFTPVRRRSARASSWRSVAALLVAAVAVGVLTMVAEGWWAGREADRLGRDSTELYSDIFPDADNVRDIRRDLRRRLGQGTGESSGFLHLLYRVSAALDTSVRVRSLNYQDSRGEMTTEVIVGTFDALESIKERMSEQGVAVDVKGAQQTAEGVSARLSIRDV